jgi:hypothetical protein
MDTALRPPGSVYQGGRGATVRVIQCRLASSCGQNVAMPHDNVWIFHADGARFASGVFNSKADAMAWVAGHRLTGLVTEYPVGVGCYDLAVAAGRFTASKPHHGSPEHVGSFSPGLDHVPVVDGVSG